MDSTSKNTTASSSGENTTIPRPSSLLVGPSSQLRAPSSLLSSALPSSFLTEGDNGQMALDDDDHNSQHPSMSDGTRSGLSSVIAARPRRLWTIQDTALRRIPEIYPPLDPNCTTYVGDASPSVVAVRISECFRKRSMAVEYDDESVSASVMTVDRCHFQVQLWKGNVTSRADFSHGVVVECIRIRGSTLSFYPACRAILQAALGQSTGDDLRPGFRTSGLEFNRLVDWEPSNFNDNRSKPSRKGVSPARAVEQAKELLKKDRVDTQFLGMQRLVDLTTPSICGTEIALYVSMHLLQEDPRWLIQQTILDDHDNTDRSDGPSVFGSAYLDSNITHSTIGSVVFPEEGRHESAMRACALRVLSNAVGNLAQAKLLKQVLSNKKGTKSSSGHFHPLVDIPMLNSLVSDLKGANRPPSIVQGTALASVHETALAVRILRILGEHAPHVRKFLESESVLERLEIARVCGRSTHLILQQEAERTYSKLTEDVRSC